METMYGIEKENYDIEYCYDKKDQSLEKFIQYDDEENKDVWDL